VSSMAETDDERKKREIEEQITIVLPIINGGGN
jgi:hypothetical protein